MFYMNVNGVEMVMMGSDGVDELRKGLYFFWGIDATLAGLI